MEIKVHEIISLNNEIEVFKLEDAYKFYCDISDNRSVISILRNNYRDFSELNTYHNSIEIEERLWDHNPTFRLKLQRSISRKLSNYLNSVFATVDYSRAELIPYFKNNTELVSKINLEKDIFLQENPEHKFIQDLRNFTTHKIFLKVGSGFAHNIEWTSPMKRIYLEKKHLLQWDGWSKSSKRVIDDLDRNLYLNNFIDRHYLSFCAYQNWLFLQMFVIDRNRTEKCIHEISGIYQKAVSVGQPHWLPFSESFIRFINYSYQKALHTTSAWQMLG